MLLVQLYLLVEQKKRGKDIFAPLCSTFRTFPPHLQNNIYTYTTFAKQPQQHSPQRTTTTINTTQEKMMPSSSSSKRVCVRAPTEIGADELSHITGFLFNDAFESACDLANMSRVCRSWREVSTWSQWSKAFGFFPLGKEFPTVLIRIMACARKNGMEELEKRRSKVTYRRDIPWAINRFAAKEHLGFGVKSWRALKYHHYDDSREAGDKHLYTVGDVLREAASRFVSVAALEKRVLQIALATAKKEKKERLMGGRHVQVAVFLRSVGGECFAVDSEIRPLILAYIWQGAGDFSEICQKVWEKRRAKDDEDAREIARVYQEIEADEQVVAGSRAKHVAKTRMNEERLIHYNAFLERVGTSHEFRYSCSETLLEMEMGVGTFEDLRTSLAAKHLEDKKIAAAEEAAYLDKGGDRRIYAHEFLRKIGGCSLIYEEEVQAYMMEGAVTFGDFTKAVLEKKHAKDEDIFKEACAVYQRLMEGRSDIVFAEERVALLDRMNTRRTQVAAFLKSIGGAYLIHEYEAREYILHDWRGRHFDFFQQQMVKAKRVKGEENERKLLGMGPLREF